VRLPRFYVTGESVEGDRLTFEPGEARHIVRVLRLGPGDLVAALDGHGREYTVRLDRVTPRRCAGTILARRQRSAESPLVITLAQGIPKSDKMETIIRAATELGVARIVPLITRRTVPHLDRAGWTARGVRWQRVAREAAKQSGRAVVPAVEPPRPIDDFLSADPGTDLRICLWEAATTGLASALEPRGPASSGITLVVGPEGGLASEEVDLALATRGLVAGLGPRLLRTETAGLTAVAIVQYLYGDLGGRASGSSCPSRSGEPSQ
jgi:16S rRNA (uracil1498-N3)-methyltransferase